MKMDMREWNEFSMQSKYFTVIAASLEVPLLELGLVRGLFIKCDPYKYGIILDIDKEFSATQTNLGSSFTFKNINPSEAKYSNIGFASWQKDYIFLYLLNT